MNIKDAVNTSLKVAEHARMCAELPHIVSNHIDDNVGSIHMLGTDALACTHKTSNQRTNQIQPVTQDILQVLTDSQYTGAVADIRYFSTAGNGTQSMLKAVCSKLLYCIVGADPIRYISGAMREIRGTVVLYQRARELLMDEYHGGYNKYTHDSVQHLARCAGGKYKGQLYRCIQEADKAIKASNPDTVPTSIPTGLGTRQWWKEFISAMDTHYKGRGINNRLVHPALRLWADDVSVDLYLLNSVQHHYTGDPSGLADNTLEVRPVIKECTDWEFPCGMGVKLSVLEPVSGLTITLHHVIKTNLDLLMCVYSARAELAHIATSVEEKYTPAIPRLQITCSLSMLNKGGIV